MKELLHAYYKSFALKDFTWNNLLSDDFKYIGGDMTNKTPVVGREAYINVIERFSKMFTSMSVINMIVEGEQACVIGKYNFKFPNGAEIEGNVAEIWTANSGMLTSLQIYFDTLTFSNNSKKP